MSAKQSSGTNGDWVEHLSKAAEGFIRDVRGVCPSEARKHFRNSRRELLLGFRSLLDKRIEDLKDEPERKARKVNVE